MKIIKKYALDAFLSQRKEDGKFFTVCFRKKDGSYRVMNCKAKVTYDGGTTNRKANDDLIGQPYRRVYDMTKKNWRRINLDTMEYIKFDGQTHWVV